jgi:hypothetical protein
MEDHFIADIGTFKDLKNLEPRVLFRVHDEIRSKSTKDQVFMKESDGQIVVEKKWDDEIKDWTEQGVGFHVDNFEQGHDFVEEIHIADTIDLVKAYILDKSITYFLFNGETREIERFEGPFHQKQFIVQNRVYKKDVRANGDVFLIPQKRENGKWKGCNIIQTVDMGKQEEAKQVA